ncbi:MAG: fasciclin domain-containing protein [Pseudomonadota bacterium]
MALDPITFTIRDVDFRFENGVFTLRGEPVPALDVVRFALGVIDLTPPDLPTIAGTVVAVSGAEGLDDNGADFDILREALAATDLTGALDDAAADLSVFAPTDDAFIQLARDLGGDVADGDEAAALSAILAALTELGGGEAEGLELLSTVLLTHVSVGGKTLADLQAAGDVTGLSGVTVSVEGDTVVDLEPDLADPTIALSDIFASNGVIQAIDRVILPLDLAGNEPEAVNIVDIAAGSDDFQILVQALTATDLVDTVRNAEDVTVFAPTDAAFGALAGDLGFTGDQADEDAVFAFLVEALTGLGGGDPIPLLTNILTYHVSPGAKSAVEIDAADTIATLNGATFKTEGSELLDREPDVANPNIVIEDIAASNGSVQAIDRVLLPLDIPGNQVGDGGRGDDELIGGDRDDHIAGRRGDDTIDGGRGDDVLRGGKGRDEIFGGEGDDILRGGKGRDELTGGGGDDKLIGGRGRDSFDFADLSGADTVRGLSDKDTVTFDSADLADFDALLDASLHVRGGTLVTVSAEDSVFFSGVALDEGDSGVFDFV